MTTALSIRILPPVHRSFVMRKSQANSTIRNWGESVRSGGSLEVDPAQPLDYAPKKTPDETGQLSEEFGLEKDYKPNVG